jgi:hypothetical protein
MNHDEPIRFIITGQVTILDCRHLGENKERDKQKRKSKFEEDESPNYVTFPVKIVGKEDIGSFFFPKHPGMISTLLHQLMHPGCITRVLLAVGPPGFTKGD